MDDFQAASDRFLEWFKSIGGQFRDDLLRIVDLRSRGAGRGIIATKEIPPDTVLFAIPRDGIISVQTSDLTRKLPHIFDRMQVDGEGEEGADDDFESLDSWSSLILVMLYEYLQGGASKWKPYFDVLPGNFETPIFWSQDDLEELEGTSLSAEKIGKDESDAMLRTKILPIVLQNASVFFPPMCPQLSEDELLSLAHRMGSTIMAYAFDLETEEDEPEDGEDGWVEDREAHALLGMVPMADTLNANAEFNAHVNHGEALEVTAIGSAVKAGDEILNYYGPLPSSELLRRYGYVTPEHSRYDVVEIKWDLVRSILKTHVGLVDDVLNQIDGQMDEEETEDVFVLERDSGEPDSEGRLTELAKLRDVLPELEEQLKAYLKILKKSDPALIPDKRKRDEICKAVTLGALEARLTLYPTAAQEDQALLTRNDIPKRLRMAVEVRLGEKQLLAEAIALLRSQGGSSPDAASEEGRAAKRARLDG